MGAIVFVVGIIFVAAVIAAIVVFAVSRSRRDSSAGPAQPGAAYPTQQPVYPPTQPQYPMPPQQIYSTSPGQPPLHLNPYIQQPPQHGQ